MLGRESRLKGAGENRAVFPLAGFDSTRLNCLRATRTASEMETRCPLPVVCPSVSGERSAGARARLVTKNSRQHSRSGGQIELPAS